MIRRYPSNCSSFVVSIDSESLTEAEIEEKTFETNTHFLATKWIFHILIESIEAENDALDEKMDRRCLTCLSAVGFAKTALDISIETVLH